MYNLIIFLLILTILTVTNGNDSINVPAIIGSNVCQTKSRCCPESFDKSNQLCVQSICDEKCLNGGQCINGNQCICPKGYTGNNCEIDYRTGPCFTNVKKSLCINQIQGVQCTKQLCCATVGKAWGHPCEECLDNFDCPLGHIKNYQSGECLDIDECKIIPNLCYGGNCTNTVGSFKCQCKVGEEMNLETNQCDDINECRNENICINGKCVNIPGSFYCLCNPGYIQSHNRQICIDGRQGHCYTSRSERGYCKNRLPIRLSKKDCCCGKNMGQGWGSLCLKCPKYDEDEYQALCFEHPRNYSIPNQNDNHVDKIHTMSIITVNECVLRPDICGNGTCIDTLKGYECKCHKGFELDSLQQFCQDIDECKTGYCKDGKCINYSGGFICQCPKGFDLTTDGTICIDHNECEESGMCDNGICKNMNGTFECQCKNGFKLSTTGYTCIDIDECSENPKICLNGKCLNSIGSYKCACQRGFTETSDMVFCADINECEMEKNVCKNGKCINSEGSYYCICDSGYTSNYLNKSCIDIDECKSNPCKNGQCINMEGSFLCECNPELNLDHDGRTCIDSKKDICYQSSNISQCSQPSPVVVTKSSCCCYMYNYAQEFSWGSKTCEPCPILGSLEFEKLCPFGIGLSFNGIDINECSINPNICQNGACENILGSFRCVCNPGYELDISGRTCIDINECDFNKQLCFRGQCINTLGSYHCICPTGTKFNSELKLCEDINECEESPNICLNANCLNSFGSFLCQCEVGFVLDRTRKVCVDNRKRYCWTKLNEGNNCEHSLSEKSLKSECCCSTLGVAWGSPCEQCNFDECECPKGYAKYDGITCSDINECEINQNICAGGGICINIEGSFTCQCHNGLTLDNTGTSCLDNRTSICYTKHKFGQCSNPLSGVYKKNICCCSALGKSWGLPSCDLCPIPNSREFHALCSNGLGFINDHDINECAEFPGICLNGICVNTLGSYKCICHPGYALDEFNYQCIDIDECVITFNPCGNGTCHNQPGSFHCDCHSGYKADNIMNTCDDINECEDDSYLCTGGQCINTIGSFYCQCPDGHELTIDQKSCKDIDECSRTSGICSNGICQNLMGTYQCICDEGFKQANQYSHCEDINECQDDNGNCDDICINTFGSYQCSCGLGYFLQNDEKSCKDIDECSENPRICNGGKCENKIGSYKCECENGLILNANGSKCIDIDECLLDQNICGYGECINIFGSYECYCISGFSVKPENSSKCTDDDECQLNLDDCDLNAICTNNLGSYKCQCNDGYNGNGFDCKDINECLYNNGNCDLNAECINTNGSYRCECNSGYFGDGKICRDIDECMEDANLCENGHCINNAGSYRCECEMGFKNPHENNDQACIDINECEQFRNLCLNGRCENLIGMFRCDCYEGYKLDNSGANCTDINECENPQYCLYGECINHDGYYECKCPENYDLVQSGNACVDRRTSRCYLDVDTNNRCRTGFTDYSTKSTCCCSIGVAWGPYCEKCPVKGSDEYDQLCPSGSGYRPNPISVVLEDIHECEEFEHICQHGHCINTFGSFICSCKDGFKLDESKSMCLDIDECKDNTKLCKQGYCINEEGTFRCHCPHGYMPLPNGRDCIDMRKDICFLELNGQQCLQPMSQIQTRKLCCCSMGQAWSHDCTPCPLHESDEFTELCGPKPGQIMNQMTNQTEDIDECSLMPTLCTNGICLNTPESFYCQCDHGYVYEENSHQCVDDNECIREQSPCYGNAQCINYPGKFKCQCPEGYDLDTSLQSCHDIDECLEVQNICNNGVCRNLIGSFQCICNNGFYLSSDRYSCLDIDECTRTDNICTNNGTCVNTFGSYTCYCQTGFKLSENNECVDIDECYLRPYLCRNGKCKNTIGSFTCECSLGYVLSVDGTYCRDINECYEIPESCAYPGNCENVPGSFICICPDNFTKTTDNKCIDINECEENPKLCEHGECLNTEGGYYCKCFDGYIFNEQDQKCIDVRKDLCYNQAIWRKCSMPRAENLTLKECCCSKGIGWGQNCQRCPTEDTNEFIELCPNGYGRLDSGEDINECLINNMCNNGFCVNTDGSFICKCSPGYTFDITLFSCVDINECETIDNICKNGTCTNTYGSFQCSCNPGFAVSESQVCEDINECLEFGYQCAFQCHNTIGSYTCTCPYGYTLADDGNHCEDINECATLDTTCKYECKNLIGSYKCACFNGYRDLTSDGNNCEDINECIELPNVCQHGSCFNLNGSYECECDTGFSLSTDRHQCIRDVQIGYCFGNELCKLDQYTSINKVTKIDCCCSLGVTWGDFCESCPKKYSKEFYTLCIENQTTISKTDVDECSMIPNLCQYGTCINTFGSYRCKCNKGFRIDRSGTICKDINECQKNSPCQFYCKNTIGSYTCSCPSGYVLNIDKRTCKDINECTTGQHTCQQICTNIEGSYVCSCNEGFERNGDLCIDINECLDPNLCSSSAKCLNTIGSFKCICPRGTKIDSTGRFCKEHNVCSNNTNNCDLQCSFGFRKNSQNQCTDINECLNNLPCGPNGICMNTFGNYHCVCPKGYLFNKSLHNCLINTAISCPLATHNCAYGCNIDEHVCVCPNGYKEIDMGHCISSIVPFDVNLKTFQKNKTNRIISTEGCISCKVNGRQRRNLINMNSKQFEMEVNNVKNRHNKHILYLKLAQTKRKTNVMKILPAIKNNVKYWIEHGNDKNRLELRKKHGVWTLSFRKNLRRQHVFHIIIYGKIIDNSTEVLNESFRNPLILSIKIIVKS